APGLWSELRARPLHLQADYRGSRRPPLGGKSRGRNRRRRDAGVGGAVHRAIAGDVMAEDATSLAPSVHASAVLVGARAVLIRGLSGAGKSRLALALLTAADSGVLRFARLVGDDRLHLHAAHGRLLVQPADTLAGLIEVRS